MAESPNQVLPISIAETVRVYQCKHCCAPRLLLMIVCQTHQRMYDNVRDESCIYE